MDIANRNREDDFIEREPGWGGGVNLAGKGKNLFFLVTIDVYRLGNRKIEVCRVSGGGRTHGGLEAPRERQVSLTLYGPNSFFRRFSGHNLR